jgi:hypothetical protein
VNNIEISGSFLAFVCNVATYMCTSLCSPQKAIFLNI